MRKKKGFSFVLLAILFIVVFGISAHAVTIPGLTVKWSSTGKRTIYGLSVKVKNRTGKKVVVDDSVIIRDFVDEESYLHLGSFRSYLDGTSMVIFDRNKSVTIKNKATKKVKFNSDGFVLKLDNYSYMLLAIKVGGKKYTVYYYPLTRESYIKKGWKFS